MAHSPCLRVSQKVPHLLRNPSLQYRVHKNRPLCLFLSNINTDQLNTLNSIFIHFHLLLLLLLLPSS
jgi:hypothetical protein